MDIDDFFKISKKLNAKQLKKFGFWGLIVGLIIFIVILILGFLLLGLVLNLLGDVFDFGVLGRWLKDFINGFIPGFVR